MRSMARFRGAGRSTLTASRWSRLQSRVTSRGSATDPNQNKKFKMQRGAARAPLRKLRLPESSVAITAIDADPAVIVLDVAAAMIPVITASAPVAFAGNRRAGTGTDHCADSRTTAAAHRATDDGARGSAEEGTAKGVILC